jgi:parvulin-like peptidyl-prolyl isomerase
MKDESQLSRNGRAERNRSLAVRGPCFALRSALAMLLFALSSQANAQQLIDQIVTLVNGDMITRTDLLWGLALDPKAPSPAGPVSSDLLRQKLDVMIDQRLIAQEAGRVPTADLSQEEINQRRTALIKQFASESAFRQRVESVGLTPQRIDDLIREMILIERFVEFRFRSFVLVTDQDIQRYYNDNFAAEIRRRGQVPPSLDDVIDKITVRERINEILKQEKINDELDRWIKAARERADIVQLVEL